MDRGPDPDRENRRTATSVVVVLFVALAIFMEQQARPAIGIAGALIGAVLLVFGISAIRTAAEKGVERLRKSRTLRWILAAVLLLAAGAAVTPLVYGVAVGQGTGPKPFSGSCPEPAELRVLTSLDGLGPTRDLLDDYVHKTLDAQQCPTVHAFVYAAATSPTASSLAAGWRSLDDQNSPAGDQDPVVTIGPRPDVWLPDSTVDVRTVEDLARRGQFEDPIRGERLFSLGSSHLAIARLGPLPGAGGTGTSWAQAMSSLHGAGIGLMAPDPGTSTTGLLAMVGYLRDGDRSVSLAEARVREQTIVASGGSAAGDAAAMLCRYGQVAAPAPAAVVTSDQLWQWFSRHPRSHTCPDETALAGVQDGVPPAGPADGSPFRNGSVLALAGPPVLDHPFVEFSWTDIGPDSAAGRFEQWLKDAVNAAELTGTLELRDGLRNFCADDRIPSLDDPCLQADVAGMLDLYGQAKTPGRVLFALDASGSMGEPADGGHATRLSIAADAIDRALGQIGPQDAFGLWTFSGPARPAHVTQVEMAAGSAEQRRRVGESLAAVRPSGQTPLYRTVVDGLGALAAAGNAAAPRALVVLTDGQDTSSDVSLDGAVARVAALNARSHVQLFMIATGEASCAGAARLDRLTEAGHGRCLDATLDQIAGATAELFDSLWRGQ